MSFLVWCLPLNMPRNSCVPMQAAVPASSPRGGVPQPLPRLPVEGFLSLSLLNYNLHTVKSTLGGVPSSAF